MLEKKIKIFFIILNIAILVLSFFYIKNQTFYTIDTYIYGKLFNSYVDKYQKGVKNIALIKIDKKFFSEEGVTTSTFHRGYYAKLIKKLNEYKVKNIVFDVYFQELKYGKGETKAQKLYQKAAKYFDKLFKENLGKNIVLGALPSGTGNNVEAPAKDFLEKGVSLGYVKSHINKEDINDGVYPYGILKDRKILTLGYEAYINSLQISNKISNNVKLEIKKTNSIFKVPYFLIKTNKGIIKIPLSKDSIGNYFISTPLFVNKNISKSYSIYDIIHDEDNIYKEKLQNKTIFIGSTDESLNDVKLSYIGIIPGVMFHINNFLAIKNKDFFYELPIGQSFIILLIMFIIGYFLVVVFKNEKIAIGVFITFIFVLFISSYTLFLNGMLLPVGTIIVILLIKLLIDIIHILFINQEKRKFLSKLFDKYVGAKVRTEKEKTNKTGIITKNKKIALMFSDIASFTNISEKLNAEQVGSMLNIYFQIFGKFIRESNGYVDKYIGDAVMAYWEDKKENDDIIKTAINIQKAHPLIIKKVKDKLGKEIDIKTRIGLHFGEAIVGDIGDEFGKIQATAIGDNVNLASRLEGINKYYETNIIISQDFYDKVKNKEQFAIRKLDKITVKGKTEPITIYEVMNYYTNEVNDDIKNYIKSFEKALNLYFKGEFKESLNEFEKLTIFKLGSLDPVVKIFMKRLTFLINNKPEKWDGVWRFTTK